MVLSKHVRHARNRYIPAVTRQLTEAAQERHGTIAAEKMSSVTNAIQKTKMSLQNRWKLFSRFGGARPESSEYSKNLQLILGKEWMDIIQKVTLTQIDNMRKFSVGQNLGGKSGEGDRSAEKEVLPLQMKEEEEEAKAVAQKETLESKDKLKMVATTEQSFRDQIYNFPQVLSALFPQFVTAPQTSKEPAAVQKPVPKWKANIPTTVSRNSIESRTRHVLNSISTAESNASRLRRVEDLIIHIERYPEARHDAIKKGAINILLRARRKSRDSLINASIREALAVMGHIEPLPGRGIRILSIDGGGIRGLVVIEMLKKLERMTGRKVHEMFDYMCGVSTGAIISAALGGQKNKKLDDISQVYKDLSTKIFTRGTIRGASNLVWSHAYYDTELWEEMLQEQLGDKDLVKTARDANAPKFSVVSTVINHAETMAYVFRNYTLPHRVESQYIGSHRHKVWEAVRASAAAPTYFEEFKHGDYLFTDGGLMVNNPCAVAIHEAKLLWPNNPIQCVVSFGTGRTPSNLDSTHATDAKEMTTSSWKEKFYKILASATDTEAVHTMLNDLLPDHVYYRFNPYLTEMLPMEEIRPEKILQLEQDAMMYIRKNEDKFQHAARALCEQRSATQKLGDWLKLQQKLWGL